MTSAFAETLAQASATDAPAPGGSYRPNAAQREDARRDMRDDNPKSTINAGHEMAFHWLRHGDDQFGLVSCFVNGKPSALVVAARPIGKRMEIIPLFVALCEGMRVTDPDGDVIYEGGAQ